MSGETNRSKFWYGRFAVLMLVFSISVLYYSFDWSFHSFYTQTGSTNNAPRYVKHQQYNSFTKYAVFSTSTPLNKNDYHYTFYAPLSALAWQRIGFKPLILISGTEEEWKSDKCLPVILHYIKKNNVTYKFLNNTDKQYRVMLSQISRLFAASLMSDILKEDDYLVTCDVDQWPFMAKPFIVPENVSIHVLHDGGGYPFTHKDKRYQMLPIGFIEAQVHIWKELIGIKNRSLPKNTNDTIQYFTTEFGKMSNIKKGMNKGWFQDQTMISILVEQWAEIHGRNKLHIYRRNNVVDRIDRLYWDRDTKNNLTGKWTVHLPKNGYEQSSLRKVKFLLQHMYKMNTGRESINYINDFLKCLGKPYIL